MANLLTLKILEGYTRPVVMLGKRITCLIDTGSDTPVYSVKNDGVIERVYSFTKRDVTASLYRNQPFVRTGFVLSRAEEMHKEDILIQRGFSPDEIRSGFAEIQKGDWMINTITKNEVVSVPGDDTLAVFDMANRLFTMDSIDNRISARGLEEPFEVYMKRSPYVPPASVLEPYIARLVRIINRIGVYTCMSCDGWHAEARERISTITKREMKLWMRDRYSVLWMWVIMEFVFGETWEKSQAHHGRTWLNIWEPDHYRQNEYLQQQSGVDFRDSLMLCRIEDGKEKAVYEKNDRYAAFLEKHKDRLCAIRNKWVNGLANETENPDGLSFLEVRRRILKYVETDLRDLAAGKKAAYLFGSE